MIRLLKDRPGPRWSTLFPHIGHSVGGSLVVGPAWLAGWWLIYRWYICWSLTIAVTNTSDLYWWVLISYELWIMILINTWESLERQFMRICNFWCLREHPIWQRRSAPKSMVLSCWGTLIWPTSTLAGGEWTLGDRYLGKPWPTCGMILECLNYVNIL